MERFVKASPGDCRGNERGICMRTWHVFGAGEYRIWTELAADEVAASVGSGHSEGEFLPSRINLLARLEGKFGSENADFRFYFVGDFTT